MSLGFVRIVAATCWAALSVLSLTAIPAAAAPTISHSLQSPLSEADKALKANDLATASAKVQEAKATPDLTDFDKYAIGQLEANIALKQNDLKTAEAAFKEMATNPAMPEGDRTNLYTVLIEVAANLSDWPTIIEYGQKLQAMGPLDPKLADPVAVAYYNTGDKAKALAIAKAQVDAAKAAGRTPDQNMLSILSDAQAATGDTSGLEEAAVEYGTPNDWGRVIDPAFGKGMSDLEALNLYRLRIATNATTSAQDYEIMATVTTKAGYPGETVSMLEHGIAAGAIKDSGQVASQLATARQKQIADKRDLPAFEAQARARKSGDFDVKVAETYYGYGEYAKAEEAARRAMSKGGVKDPAEAPLLLGISLARQGKNAEAIDVLSKVGGNATDKKIAHLWTLYCQRKNAGAPATH